MLSDSPPSPLADWKLTLCLNTPKDLSNGHEDVRSYSEKDNKWLSREIKMSQDNLALYLQHPKRFKIAEVLIS